MRRLFFAEYPDSSKKIAFKVIEFGPRPPLIPDYHSADFIESMLDETRNQYKEAEVLINLYRHGVVKDTHATTFYSMLRSKWPMENFMEEAARRQRAGQHSIRKHQTLQHAVYSLSALICDNELLINKGLMTKDGVTGTKINGNGELTPDFHYGIEERFGADSPEAAIARSRGFRFYGYQNELVWDESETGRLYPFLRSDVLHTLLGDVTDNRFVPFVAVIGRQEEVWSESA